ncbi:5-oxoprolinase subunit C family protein [Mycobacterium sp. NPDC003449]
MTGVLDEQSVWMGPADAPPVTELRIVDAGLTTTVQDLGRPGFAHLGVTRSGAADRASLRLANRLVGNVEGAAALENTLGGLRISISRDRWVAVTGATADVRVDERVVADATRLRLRAGQTLALGRPRSGIRTYVAIQGGVITDLVFGSAATDSLSGLGPRPLSAGDTLPVGAPATTDLPEVPTELAVFRSTGTSVDLSFRWGPRDALFSAHDRAALLRTTWAVTPQCDRAGVRLTGPPLTIGSQNLPSEGMAVGAIQVPPSGQPIVFLADHPVTGGYPVIGVVTESDIDRLAQAAPGFQVRFSALSAGGP